MLQRLKGQLKTTSYLLAVCWGMVFSSFQAEIYLSWTQKTEGRFTGDIRFSRSLDGGKSFSEPVTER